MAAFMDEMHKTCLKYATERDAVAFTAAKIEEINTLGLQMLTANTVQENYKSSRVAKTEERTLIRNECYAYTKTVMDAAKVVFYNDYANRRRYRYSTGEKRGRKKGKVVDEGKVEE